MAHGTPVRERFDNDCKGLAHWVGRKINNHHPMRDRIGTHCRTDMSKKGYKLCTVDAGDNDHLLYELPDGRRFMVSVREVPADEQIENTMVFEHA